MDAELKVLNDILEEVRKINMPENPKPNAFNSVVLTSSITSLTLNASYYYDVAFNLIGGTSTNSNVYISYVSDMTPNPAVLYLNSTSDKYRLRGVKVNSITVDSTIGSASLIVAYLGYSNPQNFVLSN